jgi:hypothetical protein
LGRIPLPFGSCICVLLETPVGELEENVVRMSKLVVPKPDSWNERLNPLCSKIPCIRRKCGIDEREPRIANALVFGVVDSNLAKGRTKDPRKPKRQCDKDEDQSSKSHSHRQQNLSFAPFCSHDHAFCDVGKP